jgi:Domain of unknown function (DUF5076)
MEPDAVSYAEPKNVIVLEKGDNLTDDSSEVARIWITDGAGSSVWINAGLIEDPHVFGYLMADTVRHAARAYAGTWSIDEDEALQHIVSGLGEELREQFETIETIQEGTLN